MASLFDLLGGDKETSKSIVGSLFGLTPELVAQQQAQSNLQASQNTAMQYAQMDPMQRAQYAMFQGASGASSGLMGAIGPESAQVQRAKQEMALRQAMSDKGISLDNPKGFAEGAKLAMEMGLTDIAAKMGMAGAQLDKELSTAEKARKVEPITQAEATRLAQLQRELGPEAGSAAFLQERADQKRSVTNVNMPKQDSAFQTGLGGIQAKRLESAYAKADAAAESLGNLVKLAELNQQPLIGGALADQRKETANFLSTIGLVSKDDAVRLANTQEFEKEAKGLAISWAKKLGFNPSNADVQFIVAALPSLLTDPVARTNIINRMAKVNQDVIDETARMEQWGAKNGNLNGYKPTIRGYDPVGGFTALNKPQKAGLAEISDSDLDALIAKKRGGK